MNCLNGKMFLLFVCLWYRYILDRLRGYALRVDGTVLYTTRDGGRDT